MSQHYIPATTPDTTVIVGYDRPLRYFFATVFPKNGDPIDLTGPFTGVQSIKELLKKVKPYATFSDDVVRMLEDERIGLAITNRIVDHRRHQ